MALETLGFVTGGLFYWRAGNSATRPGDRITQLGIVAGAALGAALGSRLLYVLQYWQSLAGAPLAIWLGGKTLVGGLLGGLIGVETAKCLVGWRASTGDGFVLPLAAAIAIGRLGCQLAGLDDLTYGNPTSLPWGWDYGDGLARHPTAAYEIVAVLGLLALVRRPRFAAVPGDRFRAWLAGYLLARLLLEGLKPPHGAVAPGLLAPGLWGPLSPIQWACLAGLAYYARDARRWLTGRNDARA